MFALIISFVTQQLPRLKKGTCFKQYCINYFLWGQCHADYRFCQLSENYFVRLQVSAYQMYLTYFFGWACWSIALRFKHVEARRFKPLEKKKENDKWVKLLWEKGQFFSLDSCKLKPIRCLATSSQRNTSHHLLLYKWTLSPNPLGKTLDITWVNIHWQLALTRNSSCLYGNDVGHYLDFEMLHFGQIHFWYVTRQKAQL